MQSKKTWLIYILMFSWMSLSVNRLPPKYIRRYLSAPYKVHSFSARTPFCLKYVRKYYQDRNGKSIMEALLMSLDTKFDTMSAKVDKMSAELTAIKMECKALREEFSGVAPSTSDAHDKNVALAERTSMKQIFEEMLYELKAMRQQRAESVSKTKPVEVPRVSKLLTKQEDSMAVIRDDGQPNANWQLSSASKFRVVDIAFPKGEEGSLLEEMAKLKKLSRVPVEGHTVKGKSVKEIMAGFPVPTDQRGTDLKLANYSTIQLSNPKHYTQIGSLVGNAVLGIRGRTSEVLGYYVGSSTDVSIRAAGVLSYRIGSSASRLTVQFDVDRSNDYYKGYTYYMGLGMTPDNVPIDSKLFDRRADLSTADFCTTDSYSPNRGCSSFPSALVISTKNLLAVAELSGDTNYGYSVIIRVDLIERIPKYAIVQPSNRVTGTRLMEDGYSMLDIPQMGNLESCITGIHGCVIEVANQLNATLENFLPFISRASHYVLPPPQISPFTREMFYASDDSLTEGMFSYEIASTNLQLNVVFRVSPGDNSFAIAFASKGSPVNAASLNSYTVSEPWKTRPYIFARICMHRAIVSRGRLVFRSAISNARAERVDTIPLPPLDMQYLFQNINSLIKILVETFA